MSRQYSLRALDESHAIPPQRRGDDSPRIVALGGGHGLHNLLRGLKLYSSNLTAIVAVSDDGGSSGLLRRELHIPAPGDIRNCMQALSNAEPLLQELLDYRFSDGSLAGQSFGNLLLAALCGMSGSFDEAVCKMQQVLAITGQVLPVSAAQIALEAVFENGARITGESLIAAEKERQGARIASIHLHPAAPPALPAALEAIEAADLILLGPGSLYTSLIPHLLIPSVAEALRASRVPRIYVANLTTEAGETEGYGVAEHLAALSAHGGEGLFTACLLNNAPVDPSLLAALPTGSELIPSAPNALPKLSLELFAQPLLAPGARAIQHDPLLLAQAVRAFYEARAIRVFPSRAQAHYVLE